MAYYCNVCKKDITRGEFSYSMDKFGRALCREHQEIEKRTQIKSNQFERQEETMLEPKTGEPDANSLAKKVAVKISRGVLKGVKKIVVSSKKYAQHRNWKGKILRRMTMSQLKRLCFENKVSTKKTILQEGEYFDEDYWEEVECTKSELVSKLNNRVSLDNIISFANRNKIDIKDILLDIKDKKERWEKKETTEISEKSELDIENRWRIEVLTRDKFICRVCEKVGADSAHHIYSRKYCQKQNKPDLEWDIRNGIAVCFECHENITLDGRKWFKENEKNY